MKSGPWKASTPPQPEPLETNEEEESLSWVAAGLGFAPGVVFGLDMASYKHEWFMNNFGRNKQQSTRTSTQHLCHSDQKDALLDFKNEFGMVDSKSWVNKSDCCSWDGITCDAKSGNVIGLDLSSIFLYGQLKSNSSLFKLRHLRDLNLANNNFNNSPIPAEFDKLTGLERLDLSQSSLSGQIPINLLQLTKLVSLDLSSSDFFGDESFHYLSIDKSFLPLLARNLRNLRELDMSYVKISSEIPEEFSNIREQS
ncbi:unnamed protein product [Arabidopsis thaliana]|uniref:(thale cress) hypothetical protein n=1 Tax=Arabidopsis thaliana TaxID=3702 RepID=A0A7G2E2M6_ARATH|nr:unnamed protein product [Arabidopsis thaliana]